MSIGLKGNFLIWKVKPYMLYLEKDNYKVVDTVTCTKQGQFQIDQNEAGFHCVTIFFADKEHWVTAYLEPGETVKITGDANSPLLLQVKGGRTNDKLTAFKKKKNRSFIVGIDKFIKFFK